MSSKAKATNCARLSSANDQSPIFSQSAGWSLANGHSVAAMSWTTPAYFRTLFHYCTAPPSPIILTGEAEDSPQVHVNIILKIKVSTKRFKPADKPIVAPP